VVRILHRDQLQRFRSGYHQYHGRGFEGGVSVVVNFAVDLPGLGICAVYGDGQQLGIAVLTDAQAKAGVGEIFVPCDAGKADEIKFFILDDDKAPMFVAAACDFGA